MKQDGLTATPCRLQNAYSRRLTGIFQSGKQGNPPSRRRTLGVLTCCRRRALVCGSMEQEHGPNACDEAACPLRPISDQVCNSLPFPTTGFSVGDLIYAVAIARNVNSVLSGNLFPGSSPNFRAEIPGGGYLLVEDYVLQPTDISAQFAVSATDTSGTATSKWYIFAMRIQHL